MKAALLISGYLRSFSLNIHSLKDEALSHFNDVDIYLHITHGEEEDDKYLNPPTTLIGELKESLSPVCTLIESNQTLSPDPRKNNILNTWLKFYKLNFIKKSREETYGKYDIVFRLRPDLSVSTDLCPDLQTLKNYITIPKDSKIDKSKLGKATDPHICDAFAYGPSGLMDEYFNFYKCLRGLMDQYNPVPESLLYHYLKKNNVPYKLCDIEYSIILSLCNTFAISGDSGSGKSTLGKILQNYFSNSFLLEGDRYHKWERNDENWENITHLDPDANYISKMNKDIFDLKIGKRAYQVDYNHKTGRFTAPKEINPSGPIIVCGLHSLHSNPKSLYTLKIFMDTAPDLKTLWKLKRDVEERGHDIESVKKSIETRKEDFERHIFPQRETADIIIRFSLRDSRLQLTLLLKKKYPLIPIISSLSCHELDFALGEDSGEFNKIHFNSYKKAELFPDSVLNRNDFYDYIIFIILKLFD